MYRLKARRCVTLFVFVSMLALLALVANLPVAGAQPAPGCPELRGYKSVTGWVDVDGTRTVSPGDTVYYTILIFNYPALTTATDVKYTDEIPEWTTPNNDATIAGPPGDGTIVSQDPLTIEGMTVNWGCWSARVIKFSVTVTTPVDCGTVIPNQGHIEYKCGEDTVIVPTDDPDTPEPNDPTSVTVISASNLGITKSVSPEGEVHPGDQLDYTLTLTNDGNMNAKNVTVDDAIPAGASAVGNAAASSGTVVTQDPLKVTGMEVDVGSTQTVTFSVKVDKPLECGTVISNKGSVTYDPDGSCEKEPVTVDSNIVENPVVSAADLDIVKTVTPTGSVLEGTRLDYTLTITNDGDMDATDVTVDDVIPANTEAVGNAVASSGTVADQDPVHVTGMTVPVGVPQTVKFSVDIDEDAVAGTVISNQGSVTYDPDGPNCPLPGETDESNIVTNTVRGEADIDATKSVTPLGTVNPGDRLDYTIKLKSVGSAPVVGATFEDAIPANTSAVGNADSTSGTFVSQDPVKVTGISIPEGGTVTITFSVTIDEDTADGVVVTNVGSVTYDPDGPGPGPSHTDDTNPVSNTVRRPAAPPGKVSTHWFLSEGYTGKNLYYPGESFDTYVLIQNSTRKAAAVQATFMREFDTPVVQDYTVAAESRFTIHLNEVPGCANKHISTRLVSTNGVDIAAERSMYFDYYGKQGSTDSIGVSSPSKTWYLPEGYTGDNNYPGETFNFYVLLENPNNVKANAKLTFLREGTTPIEQDISLDPETRFTVKVDEIAGCQNNHISTRVVADQPLIAERAEYFSYYGITGGHASIGAVEPATDWLMPEGYTGDNNYPGESFNAYILLENPNGKATQATATYMREGKTPVVVDYNLAPESRFTIHLDAVPGCENAQVSTRVTSKDPIVAERAMYFDYHGIREGSDSIATTPGRHWLMPEGYTGDNNYPGEQFDSYVLLVNPNDVPVNVAVKFMAPPFNNTSVVQVNNYTLAPNSRFTIHVDDIPKFANSAFSTDVTSLNPGVLVAAEHSMYSMYYGIKGGSCSIGYDP